MPNTSFQRSIEVIVHFGSATVNVGIVYDDKLNKSGLQSEMQLIVNESRHIDHRGTTVHMFLERVWDNLVAHGYTPVALAFDSHETGVMRITAGSAK